VKKCRRRVAEGTRKALGIGREKGGKNGKKYPTGQHDVCVQNVFGVCNLQDRVWLSDRNLFDIHKNNVSSIK